MFCRMVTLHSVVTAFILTNMRMLDKLGQLPNAMHTVLGVCVSHCSVDGMTSFLVCAGHLYKCQLPSLLL